MDWCEQVIEKSEEKTPFNTNSVFTPLVQSRKIGRLIRDYALQNCDNILEKVFCSFYFLIYPIYKVAYIRRGGANRQDNLDSLERLHCRVAGVIFNFAKDLPSVEVLTRA